VKDVGLPDRARLLSSMKRPSNGVAAPTSNVVVLGDPLAASVAHTAFFGSSRLEISPGNGNLRDQSSNKKQAAAQPTAMEKRQPCLFARKRLKAASRLTQAERGRRPRSCEGLELPWRRRYSHQADSRESSPAFLTWGATSRSHRTIGRANTRTAKTTNPTNPLNLSSGKSTPGTRMRSPPTCVHWDERAINCDRQAIAAPCARRTEGCSSYANVREAKLRGRSPSANRPFSSIQFCQVRPSRDNRKTWTTLCYIQSRTRKTQKKTASSNATLFSVVVMSATRSIPRKPSA